MALWTNKDEEAGKPKYLSAADKANTYGADVAETAATDGVTAGWVLRTEGTGGRAGRVSFESLVAMGSMTTDGDAGITTQTRTITITAQPVSTSAADGESVTFTVVAGVSPADSATLGYQWQVNDGGGWADIVFATSASYTHDAATAEDGYTYQAIVSATGASPVTSDAATLTITV